MKRRMIRFALSLFTALIGSSLAEAKTVAIVGHLESYKAGSREDHVTLRVGTNRILFVIPVGGRGSIGMLDASVWRDYLLSSVQQKRPVILWADWPSNGPSPESMSRRGQMTLEVAPRDVSILTRVRRDEMSLLPRNRLRRFIVSGETMDLSFCKDSQALTPSGWLDIKTMTEAADAASAGYLHFKMTENYRCIALILTDHLAGLAFAP